MKAQYNHTTKVAYQGKNQVDLLAAKEKFNYKSNTWLTFLQARSVDLKITKGSKGVSIFKGFREITERGKNGDKIQTTNIPMGYARVFNLDQTEAFKQA